MTEQLTGKPMIRVAGEWMTEAQYARRMQAAVDRCTVPPQYFFICNG